MSFLQAAGKVALVVLPVAIGSVIDYYFGYDDDDEDEDEDEDEEPKQKPKKLKGR